MSWAAVAAAAISVGGAILSKPKAKAPEQAANVDLNAEAKNSIAANLENEPDIEKLLGKANTFNQGQANSIMEQSLPGWGKLQGSLTKTATDNLADPYGVPKDVEQNLSRLAAERGISAGTRGQFNDFSLLRDFGINSMQYGTARIGQAATITQLLGSLSPRVNPMSPMSMYVTPQQSADVAAGNRSANQAENNAQAAASNYNSAQQAAMWNDLAKAAGTYVGGLDDSGGLGGSGTNKVKSVGQVENG